MGIKTCWVITNGTAGTVVQALGLAQAIGFKNIEQKIFKIKPIFSLVPAISHIFAKKILSDDSDKLEAPWPNVVIGCGRRVIPFLLYIKKVTQGKTYCIYVQDPRISAKYFDIVVKMQHDPIKGNNVIATDFSLNLVNKKKISEEIEKYKHKFAKFSPPYFTILIGGNTKRYKMSNRAMQDLLDKVRNIVELCPGSVLITTSRRTPALVVDALVSSDFSKDNKVCVVTPDSEDSNPYFAMLGLAEKIFVTNDSVNMISEAYACGKPVYIVELLNISLGKTEKFLQRLIDKNLVKIFDVALFSKDLARSNILLDPRLCGEYEGGCGEYEGGCGEYEGGCGEYEGGSTCFSRKGGNPEDNDSASHSRKSGNLGKSYLNNNEVIANQIRKKLIDRKICTESDFNSSIIKTS